MTSEKRPIWDSSSPANTRYRAKEDISYHIGKGSIIEINKANSHISVKPAYCTIHLLGSTLKMYLSKPYFDAIKGKLELING